MNAAARLALPIWPERRSDRQLAVAIVVSLVLHTLLLTLHFKFPEASRSMRDKAMDIILVNAKSARAPKDHQALAQTNMDGGGNVEEDRRATTPLPPQPQKNPGTELEQLKKRAQELEARHQSLMTQVKSKRAAAVSQTPSETPTPSVAVNGMDLADSARAMARLEGEIGKQLDEYSKRPRKTDARTKAKEVGYAQYVMAWTDKVERVGTLNYPAEARGKLYGKLVMTVSLKPDGSVAEIVIDRPSGSKILDDAAVRIVRMAAPYSEFPPQMRKETDIFEITRTWHFTQGDALGTSANK